jgi:hypothetical protein
MKGEQMSGQAESARTSVATTNEFGSRLFSQARSMKNRTIIQNRPLVKSAAKNRIVSNESGMVLPRDDHTESDRLKRVWFDSG